MSGLEVAGLVLAVLGSVEQAIRITESFRGHLKALRINKTVIQQLLISLNGLQHDLKQLQSQLEQPQLLIPQSNYQMIKEQLKRMESKLEDANQSLSNISQSTGRNLKHFFKASKCAENCQTVLQQLEQTQQSLSQINFFLGNNAAMSSTSERTNQNINQTKIDLLQGVGSRIASSSITHSKDTFQPHFQKVPISVAAKPDFQSIDSEGNHLTLEGKIKKELKSAHTHAKIYSILGPGGVGKTTTMHMLTHDQQLKDYFCDGMYYLKLGADAKVEGVIHSLGHIMQKSGGVSKGEQLQVSQNIRIAMVSFSEWFMNKKYLLLVDDVWEQKELGLQFLSLLKNMIATSNAGGMVLTSRDPSIATEAASTFHLSYREPQGAESRAILFHHARQKNESKYGYTTEKAIQELLKICGGLPVAHSVVGKGVLQYSLRRNVREEDAWRLYAERQHDILQCKADGYDCLSTVFKTAIGFLEEEASEIHDKTSYCYGEIYRSLCVLQKQQCALIEMLLCLLNVDSKEKVREICANLERVGLAEWYHEEVSSDQELVTSMESISIHDLLHEFSTEEAKRENEIETWYRRITKGYENRIPLSERNEQGCREWWKIVNNSSNYDGGYVLKNICRHLYHGRRDNNEVVILVTRPQWIGTQLSENGLLQYERDIQYACDWIERRGECTNGGDIEMKEVEMIRDAARLSASYIYKNSREV